MGKGFETKNKNKTGVKTLIGNTTGVWFSYLRRYRFEGKYALYLVTCSLIVWVCTPFRWWEKLRLGRKIAQTKIHDEPVFILGHWRGGTTLLHNLLVKDPRFGYVTYLQGLFPHSFLGTRLFVFIAKYIMPPTRPMDNMSIEINSPQEEELVMINQNGHSVYNMWVAPKHQMEIWEKYGTLEQPAYRRLWMDGYLAMLKKATFHFGGKPLVLKNPPNTARIAALLEQFPNAKFIHISRNPYKVYASTYKLYRSVIDFFQFQEETELEVDANMMEIYKSMYAAYERDKRLIPEGNLIEVRFEDFVKDKEGGLREIYERLNLGGFERVEPIYREYINSIKDYKKNKLRNDDGVIQTVNAHWGFAFGMFDYEMQEADAEPLIPACQKG